MNPTTDPAVVTTGLTKRFGTQLAVDRLDLSVPPGCVYGFLGPNGAGKTTTVRMLATLLRPDAGTAHILGHDLTRRPDAVRERISLTGQFAALDADLTGAENLRLLARLRGYRTRAARARADDLLCAFDLTEAGHRPVKTYSGGMTRRLDVAAALLTRPELLFLDEPTTGLDPASRNGVWQAVRTLAAEGTTVLLTTQYLDEADQLAQHIAVIDHGRLIAQGTPGELKSATGTGALRVHLADPAQSEAAIGLLTERLGTGARTDQVPDVITVPAVDPVRAATALGVLAAVGIEVTGFSHQPPSLDEAFLALTSHSPNT